MDGEHAFYMLLLIGAVTAMISLLLYFSTVYEPAQQNRIQLCEELDGIPVVYSGRFLVCIHSDSIIDLGEAE